MRLIIILGLEIRTVCALCCCLPDFPDDGARGCIAVHVSFTVRTEGLVSLLSWSNDRFLGAYVQYHESRFRELDLLSARWSRRPLGLHGLHACATPSYSAH